MRLFKRGQEEKPPECPECRERIPAGVTECAMCGHTFAPEGAEERFSRERAAEEAPR
jgi:ribosomal protein L37AE/L43A